MLEALRDLGRELLAALADVAVIAGDQDYFVAHMRSLGWEVTTVPPPFQSVATAGERIIDLLSSEDFEDEAVLAVLEATVRIVDAVHQLQSASQTGFPTPAAAGEYWSTIAREFLDSMVVDYLTSRRPTLGAALKLLGLVRENPISVTATRLEYVKREVRWDAIGTLIADPKKGFNEAFDWSGAPRLRDVIDASATLLQGIGLEPRLTALDDALLAFLKAGAIAPNDADTYAYDLQWSPSNDGEDAQVDFGTMIYLRPPTAARAASISILPYARLSGSEEIALGERLSVTLKGQADFTKGLAITITPGAPVTFESGFIGGSSLPPAEALVGIKLKPDETGEILLFGTPDASRFAIGSAAFLAGAKSGNGGKIDALIDLAFDDAKLVIKPGPDDADSFLASVLPADGLTARFSLSLRYSSLTGFHLGGSGGLEANFPSRMQIGPIELQSVTLGVRPQGNALTLSAGATIAAKLGPLQGVVENVGLRLAVTFPDPPNGNLGPANVDFGFKPPSGVGLSLDLSVIKGGGYLFFDLEKGEYAGALEFTLLEFISVKAIGLINTKTPDGSKGFSLLLILTAEFNPGLQLSFGFTLIGVGGLVGLNRAMRFDPILAGVRTGAITSVMFPEDVVANAPRILNDLRAFFPPQAGTFLLGPMVKIGWGTPTLISISMGVILEIPGNIAILGVLELALPTKDAPILQIKVAFAGGIDFEAKRIFFVAGMFDSRVLTMALEGGMGFYISYGDDPVFVLTVGGFHPRFAPPALPFQSPDRVALSILNTSVARIRVENYFAVTSNTVQFGARAELFFGLGPCEVSGHIGFDALFQFSPFYVIIEVSGSISLRVFGVGLFSIRLRFSLEGLTPWRARGEGSISFLFFDVSANFDITWGDVVSEIERFVLVLPILITEIKKTENWKQTLPDGLHLLVTLRKIEDTGADLVMHPLGALEFSQRAIPFDRLLDKIGEQTPSDVERVSVRPKGTEIGRLGETREQFSPGQFEKMDAAAKLARKSYEPMASGLALGPKGAQFAAPKLAKRRVRYEEEIIDSNYKRFGRKFGGRFAHLFNFFLLGSAVALSPISARSKSQLQPFADKIKVRPEGFVVVHRNDNTPYTSASSFKSEAEAHDHLKSMDAGQRAALHIVPSCELAA
jgi:hypothetical protein